MRILNVIPSLSPRRGGPSFALLELARALTESGQRIDVVTTDDDGPDRCDVSLESPSQQEGFRVFYFPRQTTFYSVSLPMARWLDRHLASYDLVHIHALFTFSSTVAARLARRKRVPYIVRPLGTLAHWGFVHRRPLLKRTSTWLNEAAILRSAARVHFTSEQEQFEAQQRGLFFRPLVIPNVVSGSTHPRRFLRGRFRARFPALGDRPFVLFLSRVDEKKGLDLLIDAFARLRDRAHMLVIAGDGPDQLVSALRSKITKSGLESRVLWSGFLDPEEKWAALADARLFALTSRSENFGIAPIEALTTGTPVLLTDQVCVHREVAQARAGWVVPCDVGKIATTLEGIVGRSDLADFGARGIELTQSRFSRQAVSRQILAAYQEVLSGR